MTSVVERVREERGAVAAIVAISMIGLLGMLVLTVDVGGMLTMRRRVVASADAAALAGAESCARQNPGEAQQQADTFAVDNEPGSTETSYSAQGCSTLASSGTVSVGYKAPVSLSFAPVLGLPSQTNVAGSATAQWAPAGAGVGTLPIVVSLDSQNRIPCVWQSQGTACNYWYDNSASGFDNSSNWGFINLDTWGVSSGDSCPSAGTSTRRDWIDGVGVPQVSINVSGPTYVCADSGHSTPSWFDALAGLVGDVRFFPVNDPNQMVLHPSGKEKYDIIGFTALEIQQVLRGDDPAAAGTPGVTSSCSTTWSPSNGSTVDLDAVSGKGCPGGSPPASLSNLVLSSGNGSHTVTYANGTDYTFDTSTDVITWTSAPQAGVSVDFDWGTVGTPGACGAHGRDPNAVCLVASWQGAQVGGTRGGGGRDFGVRAIWLSN
jgi:Flp pilus assembly protein TadG